jgi:hypothetical protein
MLIGDAIEASFEEVWIGCSWAIARPLYKSVKPARGSRGDMIRNAAYGRKFSAAPAAMALESVSRPP